jgi:hypothetical protein
MPPQQGTLDSKLRKWESADGPLHVDQVTSAREVMVSETGMARPEDDEEF